MATVTTMTKLAALTASMVSQSAKPETVNRVQRTAASLNQYTRTASASSTVTLSSQSVQMATASGRQMAPAPVSYTDNIKLTKDKTLDPLLAAGNYWWHTAGGDGSIPSAVAKHALTYSFMSSASSPSDATGFAALTNTQKDSIRDALDYISSVVDITFTEVGSGGDIAYGTNDQTATSSAGYATYPNTGTVVYLANNVSTFSGSWDPGSYTWQTILHETGHALGLKHPGNYNAGGGGTPKPYLSKTLDNRSYSIMSYNDDKTYMRHMSYNGSAFTVDYLTPATYQSLDIAALQYLYGAPTVSAGTYAYDDQPLMTTTIWNSNANSVLDLSNQTGTNIVDLRAGNFSSIGIHDAYADMSPFNATSYAGLVDPGSGKKISSLIGVPTYTGKNNLSIAKGSNINTVNGGSGQDTIITNTSSNTVDAGDGNDAVFVSSAAGGTTTTVTGGNGDDTVYVLKKSGAVWNLSGTTLSLTQTDRKTQVVTTLTTVELSGVEHVQLWNGKTMKATGMPIVASPVQQKKVLAYVNAALATGPAPSQIDTQA